MTKYIIEWVAHEVEDRYLFNPDYSGAAGGLSWTADINRAWHFCSEVEALRFAVSQWGRGALTSTKMVEVRA